MDVAAIGNRRLHIRQYSSEARSERDKNTMVRLHRRMLASLFLSETGRLATPPASRHEKKIKYKQEKGLIERTLKLRIVQVYSLFWLYLGNNCQYYQVSLFLLYPFKFEMLLYPRVWSKPLVQPPKCVTNVSFDSTETIPARHVYRSGRGNSNDLITIGMTLSKYRKAMFHI